MEGSRQGQPWALRPESQRSHAFPASLAHIIGAVDVALLLDLVLPLLQQPGVQHRKAGPRVVELQTWAGARVSSELGLEVTRTLPAGLRKPSTTPSQVTGAQAQRLGGWAHPRSLGYQVVLHAPLGPVSGQLVLRDRSFVSISLSP